MEDESGRDMSAVTHNTETASPATDTPIGPTTDDAVVLDTIQGRTFAPLETTLSNPSPNRGDPMVETITEERQGSGSYHGHTSCPGSHTIPSAVDAVTAEGTQPDGPALRAVSPHERPLSPSRFRDDIGGSDLADVLVRRIIDQQFNNLLMMGDASMLADTLSGVRIHGSPPSTARLQPVSGDVQGNGNGSMHGGTEISSGLQPLIDMDDDREGHLQARRQEFLKELDRLSQPE